MVDWFIVAPSFRTKSNLNLAAPAKVLKKTRREMAVSNVLPPYTYILVGCSALARARIRINHLSLYPAAIMSDDVACSVCVYLPLTRGPPPP